MASPLSICRNASYTSLQLLYDAPKSCKSAAVHHSHHTSSLRHSVSVPCLSRSATNSYASASTLQRSSVDCPEDTGYSEHQLGRGQLPEAAKKSSQIVLNSTSASLEYGAQHAAAEGSAGAQRLSSTGPCAAEWRFASLSRVLLVGQPGAMFRTLASRKWPSAIGPISLLVFLFGTVLALFAAVRGALVRKVKACKCCRGFGVVRCRLCDGRGAVDWRAKFSYSEQCPLCAAKRFVVCPDCGGHYHRRLFNHAKGSKGTLEAFFPAGGPSGPTTTRSNPLD